MERIRSHPCALQSCERTASGSSNDGMVIGPSHVQRLSEFLNWLMTFRAPDDEARCRSAKAAHRPKKTLHCVLSSSQFNLPTIVWMQQ
jgi:hypothetical protein